VDTLSTAITRYTRKEVKMVPCHCNPADQQLGKLYGCADHHSYLGRAFVEPIYPVNGRSRKTYGSSHEVHYKQDTRQHSTYKCNILPSSGTNQQVQEAVGVKYLGSGTNQEAGCRSHSFTFCSFSESPERFRLLRSLILQFFIAVRIIYNKNQDSK
jgi:hypothetical protein